MEGDFFIGAAIGSTLTKLALRFVFVSCHLSSFDISWLETSQIVLEIRMEFSMFKAIIRRSR